MPTRGDTKAQAKRRRAPRVPTGPPRDLLEPWERQPGESSEAWEAWLVYRDQDTPRSLRRAARTLAKSSTVVKTHSVRWQWVARVAAWDVEQDRAQTRAMLAEREELGRRHARQAGRHLQALDHFTAALLRRVEQDPDLLDRLPADVLARMEIQAAKTAAGVALMERLARGMNTETRAAVDPVDDMTKKSDGELRAYLLGIDDATRTREPVE